MKQYKPFIITMVTLSLMFAFRCHGQDSQSKDSLDIKLMQAAREIMTSAGTCALITVDQEGRPRVRQMDPFPPENDFTVWFGTNPRSRKVEQIRNNPKVTLYYLEKSGSGYVMIHGKALLVNDLELKNKWWKQEWEIFYPDRAGNYLLVKFIPEWMEVISYIHGIEGNPVTWEPPKIRFGRD